MAEEHDHDDLSEEEVDEANGEQLPDREVMTVLTPPLPMVEPLPGYSIEPPVSDS